MNWKYVFGELVIVVVGILLAVQVDRLVQRRGEAATLREHLDNLVADLQADSATLTEAIEYELAAPLFVTRWETFAADEELLSQLRTISAGNFSMTPYFSLVADEARKLWSEAILAARRTN